MVKMVGSSIYGAKFANAEAENGKTGRAIGQQSNWGYKPSRALKLVNGKMANRRADLLAIYT